MDISKDAQQRALDAASQLEKIGFVDFSTHLVKDVYEVIVQSSMDQLTAYGEFVKIISKDISQYERDVIGSDPSININDYIKNVLDLDISAAEEGKIKLSTEQVESLTQHFNGIFIVDSDNEKSFDKAITEDNEIEIKELEKFVEEKIKSNARNSYELIKTILKIGMQKVVVTNGVIHSKLTFHVDASDTYDKHAFKYYKKARNWGVKGSLNGRYGGIAGSIAGAVFGNFIGGGVSGGYNNKKLNISVVNEKSSAATNVTADIIGEVTINFRTETFPGI